MTSSTARLTASAPSRQGYARFNDDPAASPRAPTRPAPRVGLTYAWLPDFTERLSRARVANGRVSQETLLTNLDLQRNYSGKEFTRDAESVLATLSAVETACAAGSSPRPRLHFLTEARELIADMRERAAVAQENAVFLAVAGSLTGIGVPILWGIGAYRGCVVLPRIVAACDAVLARLDAGSDPT